MFKVQGLILQFLLTLPEQVLCCSVREEGADGRGRHGKTLPAGFCQVEVFQIDCLFFGFLFWHSVVNFEKYLL